MKSKQFKSQKGYYMPIIRGVEVHWVKADPANPQRFQGRKDAPALWSIQLRTRRKTDMEFWKKEYGFKVTPEQDDVGIYYKATLSRYAYRAKDDGTEDTSNPNKPVGCITGSMEALDPNTIGNGSIANVSFSVKEDKSGRTWKGIQVTKLIEFTPRDDGDNFELEDGFEVVSPTSPKHEDDPY
jgi:hypothetical protein